MKVCKQVAPARLAVHSTLLHLPQGLKLDFFPIRAMKWKARNARKSPKKHRFVPVCSSEFVKMLISKKFIFATHFCFSLPTFKFEVFHSLFFKFAKQLAGALSSALKVRFWKIINFNFLDILDVVRIPPVTLLWFSWKFALRTMSAHTSSRKKRSIAGDCHAAHLAVEMRVVLVRFPRIAPRMCAQSIIIDY